MAFCLTKELAEKLKTAVRSGKINPNILNSIKDSGKRRKLFEDIVGKEAAREINLSFEKKLLLKNQERAMYDFFADQVGLSKQAKAELSAKVKATYADKKRKLYEPRENEQFLNEILADTYSKKFKTEVSLEEAQIITEMSADVIEAKRKIEEVTGMDIMDPDFKWGKNEESRKATLGIDFGAKKKAADNYIGALRVQAQKRTFVVNPVDILKTRGFEAKVDILVENAAISAKFIADNTRVLKASWDNSFPGRQGGKLMTQPKFMKIWGKNFLESWLNVAKVLTGYKGQIKGTTAERALDIIKGKDALRVGEAIGDATMAEIYAEADYLNGRFDNKGGDYPLDYNIREEDFPTSLPEKIPILGRIFKASETSFSAVGIKLRTQAASKAYKIAEKQGVDLSDPFQVSQINRTINTFTGRAKFKKGIPDWVNTVFFAPRWVKSNVEFLTRPFNPGSKKSRFGRRLHAKALLSTAVSYVLLAKMFEAFGGETSFNPIHPLFGKVKFGTRVVEIPGVSSLAGYITLAARMKTAKTIDPVTGQEKDIEDPFDKFWDFTENKASPISGMVRDIIRRVDFDGQPTTIESLALNAITPIPVSTAIEIFSKPEGAFDLAVMLADASGFSAGVRAPRLTEAEEIAGDLFATPKSEANQALDDLKEKDEGLYKKVLKALDDINEGTTPLDKAMRKMNVKDMERAIFIASQAAKMKTSEEKNAYLDELKEKGLIDISEKGDNEANTLAKELAALPSAEANSRLDKLKVDDPDLYDDVVREAKDNKAGITPVDKGVRALGIKSGNRARQIAYEASKLETKEEQNAYLDDLKRKRIIIVDTKKDGTLTGSGLTILKQLAQIEKDGGLEEHLEKEGAEINKSIGESGSGKTILTQLAEIQERGGISEFLKQEAANVVVEDGDMLGLMKAYFYAYQYDPDTAFDMMFGPEQLEKVMGGVAIGKRQALSKELKDRLKAEAGLTGVSDVEIDHLVDRQLGGPLIDPAGLKAKTREQHVEETKGGNYLRGFLWSFRITEEQAVKLNDDHKDGKITLAQLKAEVDRLRKVNAGAR